MPWASHKSPRRIFPMAIEYSVRIRQHIPCWMQSWCLIQFSFISSNRPTTRKTLAQFGSLLNFVGSIQSKYNMWKILVWIALMFGQCRIVSQRTNCPVFHIYNNVWCGEAACWSIFSIFLCSMECIMCEGAQRIWCAIGCAFQTLPDNKQWLRGTITICISAIFECKILPICLKREMLLRANGSEKAQEIETCHISHISRVLPTIAWHSWQGHPAGTCYNCNAQSNYANACKISWALRRLLQWLKRSCTDEWNSTSQCETVRCQGWLDSSPVVYSAATQHITSAFHIPLHI